MFKENSQSFDTKFATHEVVDRYQQAGYKILALTDHDYNPYPWTLFNLYNTEAENRDPEAMGMLTVPGVELSKDNRNQWEEVGGGGGYFNHHNDFFTGRKGQEFATLRESYAYTEKIGGMQIINHPGQYWSLSTSYAATDKNSPQWHAENFKTYSSLVGLEVYNQGNRRPNDRILWDQILDITMPSRPVWGYSGDDTHTLEQYFRNYNIMLMPELTVDALKEAMKGATSISPTSTPVRVRRRLRLLSPSRYTTTRIPSLSIPMMPMPYTGFILPTNRRRAVRHQGKALS